MPRLMIIVGSVRPGRIGLPIARWVAQQAGQHGGFDVDFADLAEIALPFMDEPSHPMKHQYTKPHTFAWSKRGASVEQAGGKRGASRRASSAVAESPGEAGCDRA